MKNRHNAALGFIFVTLLLDATGLGIIIPVLPTLIQQLTGGDLSKASQYSGWLLFSYSIMQFCFAPVMGGLSDKYGRRPVLLASILGLGVDYMFLSFAPTIGWLFVGRVLAGIFGASFTTAGAYIADISTPEKRAQNFGLMGAAFGLGFIIGPMIGGIFEQFGPRVPFLIAAGFSFLNWVYGFFVIPESLSLEHRRKFEWKRANPIGSLKHVRRYPAIAGLIVSIGLIYIAAQATQSTWTFFTMEKFKWTPKIVGFSLGFVGLMIAIVQGGLIRIIIPKIGQKNSVYLGFLLYIIANVLFAFASESWMLFVILVPYCLGGIAGPALQGIMSNEVPPNEQGELQGVFTALMSLTSIIGPLMMTYSFAYFTKKGAPLYFPGAPFMLAAILTTISIILAARFLSTHHIVAEKPQAEG